MYNNHESVNKDICRLLFLNDVIIKGNLSPDIFTLPSTNFYLEHMIFSRFPEAKIDCCEYNLETFNQVIKTGKHIKTNYNYIDAFNYLNKVNKQYDNIWLDLCGKLNNSIIYKTISIAQRRLKKDGLLGLTVMSAREHNAKDTKDFYNIQNMSIYRNNIVPEIIIKITQAGGINLKQYQSPYHYTDNYSHMVMYTFKRQ